MRMDLIVVDGENDFLVSGNELWNTDKRRGSLCVDGADHEALLVADLIDRLDSPTGHKFSKIHVTLDAHHENDASHHTSWKGPDGQVAPPFTMVTHDDVVNHRWVPRFGFGVWDGELVPSYEWALRYTRELEKRGRNVLILWPPHCLIGEWGSNIYHPLAEAYSRWCKRTMRYINPVTKGQWPWSEHYSALIADVPDAKRRETQMNVELVEDVNGADIIVWVGWAGSHCLPWTFTDSVDYFEPSAEDKAKGIQNEFVRKSVILSDCCAAVPDLPGSDMFKRRREEFLADMQQRGAKVTTSKEFLAT